jgi:hypothetical protein
VFRLLTEILLPPPFVSLHLHLHSLERYIAENVLIISEVPVTVAERSKACIVFARSEARILGSNPTYGMNRWYVYVFILCLCCRVFR